MTTKENIINTLRATGRENIENVIDYMDRHGFFTVSCNRHHRYTGGMADHAWQTYQTALQYAGADDSHPALAKDSVAICALLHDFCDCYGMSHLHGHGYRSARMVQALGVHLSGEEFLAIRHHMCRHHSSADSFYELATQCPLRNLVHKADCSSASRG